MQPELDQRTELIASTRKEDVEEAAEILSAANVEFKTSEAKRYAISDQIVGSIGGPTHFLTVEEGNWENAPLPEDHFLHTATEDEIVAMLTSPEEWSAFDMAHAKKLAAELNLSPLSLVDSQNDKKEIIEQGKQAHFLYYILVTICLLFGGILGWLATLGIGYSFSFMTKKSEFGEHFYFNKPTRLTGYIILALLVIKLALYITVSVVSSTKL